MLNIALSKADYALIISVIGISITFINVNRQRKATLRNEEEKFKRDLNLLTYNEFVEILYDLLIVIRKFRVIRSRYHSIIDRNPSDLITNLNELTWEITDHWFNSIQKISAYYIKKEYILKPFEDKINQISNLTKQLDDNLWRFKTYIWDHNENIEEINSSLIEMESLSEQSLNELTNLIKALQRKFLGNLYK